MLKKFKIFLLAVAVVNVVIIIIFALKMNPEYNGKKASEWCEQLKKKYDVKGCEEAADALVAIGEPAIPYLVAMIYETENDSCGELFEIIPDDSPFAVLARIGAPSAEAMRKIFADKYLDMDLRSSAAIVLTKVDSGCASLFMEYLEKGDEKIQEVCISLLSKMRAQYAVPALEKFLVNGPKKLRELSAIAIYEIERENTCLGKFAILEKHIKEGDDDVRRAIFYAISGVQSLEGLQRTKVRELLLLFADDKDSAIRRDLAKMIGILGEPVIESKTSASILLNMLAKEEKKEVRDGCMNGLQYLRSAEAVPAMIKELDNKQGRAQAIKTLGAIRDVHTVELIRKFLDSNDEDTIIAASEAVVKMKDRDALWKLFDLLGDESVWESSNLRYYINKAIEELRTKY